MKSSERNRVLAFGAAIFVMICGGIAIIHYSSPADSASHFINTEPAAGEVNTPAAPDESLLEDAAASIKEVETNIDAADEEHSLDDVASKYEILSFEEVFDDSGLLSVKAIGADQAPVTLLEFSSLTCGHCGRFHKATYNALKEKYVDTGLVRLVAVDFPLNRPALDASTIAHCMPENQYMSFTHLLFVSQEEWAFSNNYLDKLRQFAALAGMGGSEFDECIANDALREALIARTERVQQLYGINSTPTFVFNNGVETLNGAQPLESFEEVIEGLLSTLEKSE